MSKVQTSKQYNNVNGEFKVDIFQVAVILLLAENIAVLPDLTKSGNAIRKVSVEKPTS